MICSILIPTSSLLRALFTFTSLLSSTGFVTLIVLFFILPLSVIIVDKIMCFSIANNFIYLILDFLTGATFTTEVSLVILESTYYLFHL